LPACPLTHLLAHPAWLQNEADVKYIDPSYIIRSIPTTSNDRIYCKVLGQGAVHGAFAGYTGFTVGLVNTHYVYLPIPTIIQAPRKVNPKGRRWNRCAGQALFLTIDNIMVFHFV
jgi:6-phosphofructokinase